MSEASVRWFQDGRLHFALGIEDTFVPRSGAGARALDEYELTEHYLHWSSDFELAADVNAEMLRWGVPWHRVQREPGVFDWRFVDGAVGRMQELGITPIVDLLHYGTPLWLETEFAHPDFPDRFADFAAAFAERYRGAVNVFTPVNEPMIHAQFSGQYGYWPPYLTGTAGLYRIATAVALAANRAQHALRDVLGEDVSFVHVDAGFRYTGAVAAPEHAATVARMLHERYLAEDLLVGDVTDRHPLREALAQHGVADAVLDELARHPARPDVMGVNYYPLHSTEVFERGVHHGGGFADPRPTEDTGVAGLIDVLTAYEDRYGVPVMLTETCKTASVPERIEWMRESVSATLDLRARGRDVVGYTWWPLFDMYEWTWRHTDAPRRDHLLTMGLFDLVESRAGLIRRRNGAAEEYRRLATLYGARDVVAAAANGRGGSL